jgi:SPP1 family predicted phage head-tail adaptor
MDVGQLRHRITIRRQVDTPDGKGGFDRAWTNLASRISAKVTNLNGREAVIANSLQGVSTFEIIVRFRTDVMTSDQIVWDGRELNVHSAEDKKGTRQWTTITASTEAPQGAA